MGQLNKREQKQADKILQDERCGNPQLNSVHEIYNQLEEEFENTQSVKSTQ